MEIKERLKLLNSQVTTFMDTAERVVRSVIFTDKAVATVCKKLQKQNPNLKMKKSEFLNEIELRKFCNNIFSLDTDKLGENFSVENFAITLNNYFLECRSFLNYSKETKAIFNEKLNPQDTVLKVNEKLSQFEERIQRLIYFRTLVPINDFSTIDILMSCNQLFKKVPWEKDCFDPQIVQNEYMESILKANEKKIAEENERKKEKEMERSEEEILMEDFKKEIVGQANKNYLKVSDFIEASSGVKDSDVKHVNSQVKKIFNSFTSKYEVGSNPEPFALDSFDESIYWANEELKEIFFYIIQELNKISIHTNYLKSDVTNVFVEMASENLERNINIGEKVKKLQTLIESYEERFSDITGKQMVDFDEKQLSSIFAARKKINEMYLLIEDIKQGLYFSM